MCTHGLSSLRCFEWRIAGEMSFDNTAVTDLEVRTRLQQPSIDCILIRKRLRYCVRIVKAMPQSLVAFLTVARADRALPWVEQMHADFAALHVALCRAFSALGNAY